MQHRLFFEALRTSQARPERPNGLPTFFMMPDANLSGPVSVPKLYDGKNKTFFFFGFQRLHEKKVAQVDSGVPSLEVSSYSMPGKTARTSRRNCARGSGARHRTS
jgi:hypothetical protein